MFKSEAPEEDAIRVVCRFRPPNDSEESIATFPGGNDDQGVNIGV